MMGFYYYENGVERYVDRYDPFPDNDVPRRRRRSRHHESLPAGWW